MKDLSTFQLGFLGILVFAAIAGLAFFAVQTNNASQNTAPVSIWGTMPQVTFDAFVEAYRQENLEVPALTYATVPENQMNARLTESLANGNPPDVILAPQDLLFTLSKRFVTIPYESYPDRTYTDEFIDHASIFKTQSGITGVPFTIDPLVLYWNRDLLASQSILEPSKTWGDFYLLAPRFTKRDNAGNITQSLVGLGEVRNVNHAKDILAALLLQTGNPIVATRQGALESTLNAKGGDLESLSVSVLRFFTEFSNPGKAVYTWNRGLPNALDAFSTGRSVYYIGPVSELPYIKEKNPYLNFDVALLPNIQGATRAVTFGRMTAFSLVARSQNTSSALSLIAEFTRPESLALLSNITGLPPVSRALVQRPPRASTFAPVFYESAIRSRGWLDPSPTQTTALFGSMVENVVSGRKELSEAVKETSDAISSLLR